MTFHRNEIKIFNSQTKYREENIKAVLHSIIPVGKYRMHRQSQACKSNKENMLIFNL